MEAWPLIKGLLTRVPGLYRGVAAARGGSIAARYCYSVWLRHLVALHSLGMERVPRAVAELGPGLSLGVGLAALLSGAERYTALDVSRDAVAERHDALVDELAALLAGRSPIPDDAEFPEVLPRLGGYDFPRSLGGLLPPVPARVTHVKALLRGIPDGHATSGDLSLEYVVPWTARDLPSAEVDLVLAQAVLEHVRDPLAVYRALAGKVTRGGYLSAVVDFRCHGLTRAWNGHWAYSDRAWRLVEGARPWGLNRWWLTRHLDALAESGFRVVSVMRAPRGSAITRRDLAPGYRDVPNDDLNTEAAFVAARRC